MTSLLLLVKFHPSRNRQASNDTHKPPDPFTGLWKFVHDRSTTSSPPPHTWTQRIEATAHEVTVREEIVSTEGAATTVVEIQARFDGLEYPVTGSTAADTITYSRIDTHRISGTGMKNGKTTLRESLAVSPDGPSPHRPPIPSVATSESVRF